MPQVRESVVEVTAMNKPRRTSAPPLRAILGVLAGVALLLLVGRLTTPQLAPHAATAPTGQPPALSSSTTRPELHIEQGIVGRVVFPDTITGLAVTPGAVWAAHGQAISRVDPTSLRPTATVAWRPVGNQQLLGIAAAPGGTAGVWASVFGLGVLRIDPARARVVARIPLQTEQPPAVGASGVWVVCCGGDTPGSDGRLLRINPATNRVAATIRLRGQPDTVGAGPSGVWVRSIGGPIWHIDPATNRVTATVAVPGGLGTARGGVLVGRDGVWVSDPDRLTVWQLDPQHARLLDLRFEANGTTLAQARDGTAWVRADGPRLIGLAGHAPVRTIFIHDFHINEVTALTADRQHLWAGTDTGMLFRIDPAATPP
jgi:DNA-binding beta-propeller fold protein YncE